jgi:hypothetical protein
MYKSICNVVAGAVAVAAVALMGGCANNPALDDNNNSSKNKEIIAPLYYEEEVEQPKQAQKAEGFSVAPANSYYFARHGSTLLLEVKNPNQPGDLLGSSSASEWDNDHLNCNKPDSGKIYALDSIFVWTEIQLESRMLLNEQLDRISQLTNADFYDALAKFIVDYTLENDRKPRVMYRLLIGNTNNVNNSIRYAEGIDPDTIAIGEDKSKAVYCSSNGFGSKPVKLNHIDYLDQMHVLSIVGGVNGQTSIRETPRVIPQSGRGY